MYDAEYIRELTAARKANEVARALIKDHEQTIVDQRAKLERARRWARAWKREAKDWYSTARSFQEDAINERQLRRVDHAELDALRDEYKALHTRWHKACEGGQDERNRAVAAYRECAALRAELDVLRAEAGLLYKTLQEIRRDVHFAHTTEDHLLKWDTLCLDIMRGIDRVTPNGTAGAQAARRIWDETRCRVCGWPLAERADRGCVPGNCSQRPVPAQRADAEYQAGDY